MDGRNGSPHELWRRGADGRYSEVGSAAGVADIGWTLATSTFDYDGDGDQDLFLANDFGVLETFKKLEKTGFENVPTWRHLKLRAVSACIPTELTFFSNAIMGLRESGTALDPRSWQKMPGFPQFCGEFLNYQLTVLQPRLTVVMGPHAKAAFDALADKSSAGRVLYTTHPYADYSFSKERRAADIAELKSAWRQA
jgi:hypothetical protein